MSETATTARIALFIGADHPALAGHFPGQPLVPGVLLLDEALRAIERHCGASVPPWRLGAVKFHQAVSGGESLELSCEAAEGLVRFELHRGRELIASGSLERGRSA
jgi:3-hydroxymyristoyl/3-hydroxydecanoyl-(acyl carrier protein) dehydratase